MLELKIGMRVCHRTTPGKGKWFYGDEVPEGTEGTIARVRHRGAGYQQSRCTIEWDNGYEYHTHYKSDFRESGTDLYCLELIPPQKTWMDIFIQGVSDD